MLLTPGRRLLLLLRRRLILLPSIVIVLYEPLARVVPAVTDDLLMNDKLLKDDIVILHYIRMLK